MLTHASGRAAARRHVSAALLLLSAWVTPVVAAQSAAPGLIDVPYYSQTPLHCGAAALTMVLRFWGHPSVVPAQFSPLVDAEAGGITTVRMTAAARDDGWTTVSGRATDGLETLADELAHGRPTIALIDGGIDVLHYVVVVGLTDDHVIVHDPARAPYRRIPRAEFDRRWQPSSRWMLVVVPGADTPPAAGAVAPDRTSSPAAPATPCDALVTQAVAVAGTDHDAAERALQQAISRCPESAAGYRELAGLRLLQERWDDSGTLAEAALARDPRDHHAIDLLAASRFAAGDRLAALQAWNMKGDPAVDRVNIDGLRRTHHPVVTGSIRIEPGQPLTASGFVQAARRLDELPTSAQSTLRYRPLDNGRVALDAVVRERRVMPAGAIGLTSVTVRALVTREVRLDIAAPFAQGDLWQPSFRWPYERRRIGLAVGLPLGQRLPGVMRVEIFRERQTYARGTAGLDRSDATRQRVSATYADWLAGPIRVEAGGGSDRHDGRRHFSLMVASTARLAADHVALHARAERWTGAADRRGFHTMGFAVDWRSTTDETGPRWTSRAGWELASDDAPLAVWPGAGSSLDRTSLLRGRRLVIDDVLAGEVFGRRLAYFTVERQQPLVSTPYGGLALATFVDAAQAWDRFDRNGASRLHVDAGVGLRVRQPGDDTQLRLDVGIGLRDGRVRVSAGYVSRWGRY